MKSVIVLLIPLFALFGCGNDGVVAPAQSTTDAPSNADIIRNPVAANAVTPADTARVARIHFDEPEAHFGEVRAGQRVRREFTFKNSGDLPLLITDARSTCGCTVPVYPKRPIQPGEHGAISVVFDTSNKLGRQRKPVTLTANTYPAQTTVYLEGTVIE
ncbi:hypothetical protein GGR28_000459 [Lewinella aquimaris]|uniref:DUF1573 domain-containing protein n=1 Tax=Neolewinella aquimaris TaxID=1835722 RepID=A0A840E701_9BACT|nr:DUF1573 domain-containing protein [Neolewinella aquimaris]MBB4077858.1 hypothetical protein [Neolewinella aquimaris]